MKRRDVIAGSALGAVACAFPWACAAEPATQQDESLYGYIWDKISDAIDSFELLNSSPDHDFQQVLTPLRRALTQALLNHAPRTYNAIKEADSVAQANRKLVKAASIAVLKIGKKDAKLGDRYVDYVFGVLSDLKEKVTNWFKGDAFPVYKVSRERVACVTGIVLSADCTRELGQEAAKKVAEYAGVCIALSVVALAGGPPTFAGSFFTCLVRSLAFPAATSIPDVYNCVMNMKLSSCWEPDASLQQAPKASA